MEDLTNKSLDSEIEKITNNPVLFDMVIKSDALYYWGCTNEDFKPKINIWYNCQQIHEAPKIDGYSLWLQFYCDYIGYCINILYPLNAKKGEVIDVIFKGVDIDGCVSWVHGDSGLFWSKLILLLFLEKYKYNEHSGEIKTKLSLF